MEEPCKFPTGGSFFYHGDCRVWFCGQVVANPGSLPNSFYLVGVMMINTRDGICAASSVRLPRILRAAGVNSQAIP